MLHPQTRALFELAAAQPDASLIAGTRRAFA